MSIYFRKVAGSRLSILRFAQIDYARRSILILMDRHKTDRFATCASSNRFHACSQMVMIFCSALTQRSTS